MKTTAGKRTARTAPARRQTAEPGRRAVRSAERREAILAAALDEFSASGYSAARLDDVARRAGVAKGTIYLYFRDKETLFQELIRSTMSPLVGAIEAAPFKNVPLRAVTAMIVDLFVREVYETRRRDVIRLMITEGQRFPKLAEFYYREVIGRVIAALRGMIAAAIARGEVGREYEALARFPQLLMAPALVSIVWSGLFGHIAPLDVRALMRAHLDLVFGEESAS
jgi:AcrR family transcriptional regulator